MKICVTGTAGFIGQWLVRELITAGHEVVGNDMLEGDLVHDQFDLLDRGVAYAWLERNQPDMCIHLAAQVGRLFGEDDISRTVRWNAEVTSMVANACKILGIRLVYASTSEVYGDQGEALCHEDSEWKLPHNLYGLSKRWGEEVAQLYAPENLVICRLSMPYGPGMPPGRGRRAMDTFLWQAHHHMPIPVHRGAERSWCWVGDTVRGIRLAAELPTGGVYNIGRDDDPRLLVEIARMACDLADAPYDLITEVDAPRAQTVVKRLATDRVRQLGWKPTVDLEQGMGEVYRWISGYDENGERHDVQ